MPSRILFREPITLPAITNRAILVASRSEGGTFQVASTVQLRRDLPTPITMTSGRCPLTATKTEKCQVKAVHWQSFIWKQSATIASCAKDRTRNREQYQGEKGNE